MSFELDPKIKLKIPEFIAESLAGDVDSFKINKNHMCNEVFRYYSLQDLPITQTQTNWSNSRDLQFTLQQDNLDIFAGICESINIPNKAEYFRQLLYIYCDQPRYMRERVMFSYSVKLVNEAIVAKQPLKIRYKNEYRTIEPYFIIKSDGETRNYIFAYCYTRQAYCNYRLSNIKAVSVLRNQVMEYYDAEYVGKMKNNFDAFLSYGKTVQVKLSPEGEKIYQRNITHRPKQLQQHDDIYTFECSELKAQLYFPQFMEHAEILAPESLRNWFTDKFSQIANIYNQGAAVAGINN